MNDLKERIADAIEDWRYEKVGKIEVDNDTDFAIHKEVQRCIKGICNDLEELDATIDNYIETMKYPSDYENDLNEDNRVRARELTYGG